MSLNSTVASTVNDAAGRTPVTTIATELGGQTLTPRRYDCDRLRTSAKGSSSPEARARQARRRKKITSRTTMTRTMIPGTTSVAASI